MKAVRFHAIGAPDVLRVDEIPVPMPGEGQVLIRLEAAGVNFADIGRRTGLYGGGAGLPGTLGLEGAGVVEAAGAGVTAFKPGEQVLALSMPGGSYAQYGLAPADAVFPVPLSLSMEEAASIGVTFLTAWHGLVTAAKARSGETVLVQAAGSGCGVAAIQLGKALGLRVITTASSDEKLAKAQALGADETINYVASDFVAEVKRLTADKGVDIVFDGVGGDVFERSIACLGMGGRLITYGMSSGHAHPAINPQDLWFNNIAIIGISVGSLGRGTFREVLNLMAQGKVKPVVDRVFPLADAAEAHRCIESRKVFGKVVLKTG